MNKIKISGKNNKHKVIVYALSTCAWCKMTKKFLSDSGVEYEFVDVDLASAQDNERIRDDIVKKGGEPSYPTTIVDNKIVILGFRKDLLQKALEL